MSQRMIDQFLEMVRIDSESGEEARMMEYLLGAVANAGGTAELDSYGNLIGRFPALGCAGVAPLLLSCHGDTVKPGKGIRPVLEGGVIRSSGDTILGADDKAGIAEVLEAMRTSTVRPPVELAVSRQEETGLQGVKNLDFSKLSAKRGFLMDNDTLETIVIGGPSYFAIDVAVTGKAAHAGMEPEKGINAIFAAARAIAALRLGRLDGETTANVGIIEGGMIRNGVPASCTFKAECRAAVHEKGAALAEELAGTIRREVEAAGAKVTIAIDNMCRAVRIPEASWTVDVAKKALRTVGVEAKCVFITGFTDASIYNNKGIEMAVVGIGAQNEHSTDECIAVADMEKAVKALVEMLRIAAQ
ncbi:MAG: M20/M25/M40 family metallo-hydrolase [Proteobacteria bacterium]|jgi:tripeptide aminopeptidase|nr:M20/M25/M40 family metallo-hydrolase [Pseudomonadota bacterium]